MNCTNCGNQMPSDAKFCNKCGKPIETKLSNEIFKKMSDHLEFLGYKIEIVKPSKKGDKELIFATHTQYNNVVISEITPNLILFRINLTTNKKFNDEINVYLNDANRMLNCCKVFYDIDKEMVVLRFEAIYTGDYNKEVFGQFIDMLNNDVGNLFRKGKDFDKIFLG